MCRSQLLSKRRKRRRSRIRAFHHWARRVGAQVEQMTREPGLLRKLLDPDMNYPLEF